MKIGDTYKTEEIDLAKWEKLCHQVHYNFPFLKKLIEQHCHAILNALEKNKDFYVSETNNLEFVEVFSKKISVAILHILKKYAMSV